MYKAWKCHAQVRRLGCVSPAVACGRHCVRSHAACCGHPVLPSLAAPRDLGEACLSSDPRARPTAPELVGRLRALLAESGALQVGGGVVLGAAHSSRCAMA